MLRLTWRKVNQFYEATLKHYDAAMYLLGGCQPKTKSHRAAVAIYVGGYVVECIFKALLFSGERPRKHAALEREIVKALKHDLGKLRTRLEKLRKPVQLPTQTLRFYRLVRREWNTNMRYFGREYSTEEAQEFISACKNILDWACGR